MQSLFDYKVGRGFEGHSDEVSCCTRVRTPKNIDLSPNPVRVAFDGDAVIFSDEADRVFHDGGLPAFQAWEAKLENVPLQPGPLQGFLKGLSRIQKRFPDDDKCPIRTALVTARSIPSHKRRSTRHALGTLG